MKKLMIAAAVAAMIGAVKADSTCVDGGGSDPTCEKQTLVYQWQFRGRTGVGVLADVTKAVVSAGGTCVDGGTTPGSAEIVRTPGALNIIAYSYLCDAECFALDTSLKAPTKGQYYMTSPLKTTIVPYRSLGTGSIYKEFITDVDVFDVIGKTATQYELAGTATFDFTGDATAQLYTLRFAGYGAYDKRNHRVTSVSGYFAGTQKPPRYTRSFNGTRCPPAGYWDCCTLTYADGSEQDEGVAYGTWSMRYNAAASARLSKNKTGYWVK